MAYHKKWREEHSEYFLDYYKQNKAHIIETLLAPVKCECGFECGKANLKRHQKSKLHAKRLMVIDPEDQNQLNISAKIEKMEKQLAKLKLLIL